nr:DUF4291 family protein [Mucilaginibacter sp. OK283]
MDKAQFFMDDVPLRLGRKGKPGKVLALWIQKIDFEKILGEAAISSFNPQYYQSHAQWRADLEQKEVRLQWDPDHDPYGNKLQRRAIQLG